MIDGSNNILEFDRYLNGEMTEAERQSFERTIRHDESLREKFRLHARTMAGLNRAAHDHKKAAFLEDLKTNPPVQPGGQIRRFMPMLLTAAAVVLILLTVGLYLGLNQTPDNWYLAQLDNVPAFPTDRGETGTLGEIQELYQEEQWADAAQAITKRIQTENEDASDLWFFLGICQLKQGGDSLVIKAEESFANIADSTLYSEDSDWWEAVAAAANQDKEKSISLLQKIAVTDSHLYANQAAGLLERLLE